MTNNKESIAAIIREELDDIELQITYGVKHQQLNEILTQAGYVLTLGGFRTALAKARAMKKKQVVKSKGKRNAV